MLNAQRLPDFLVDGGRIRKDGFLFYLRFGRRYDFHFRQKMINIQFDGILSLRNLPVLNIRIFL